MAAIAPKTPETLSNLLEGLLGRNVKAQRAVAPPLAWFAVGEYRTAEDTVAGLLVCDADSACSVAAALSLIPPAVAASAAKSKKLTETLTENLGEVLNVASQLFQAGHVKSVRLAAVHLVPAALPPATAALAKRTAGRVDLSVQVTGYAPGTCSVCFPV